MPNIFIANVFNLEEEFDIESAELPDIMENFDALVEGLKRYPTSAAKKLIKKRIESLAVSYNKRRKFSTFKEKY